MGGGRHLSWSEEDEHDLYGLLAETKAKFILSTWHINKYRKNSALEKYAQNFIVFTREHFYHVGAKEKNRNPMLEAIVLNYDPESQEAPIALEQLLLFEKKSMYGFYKISLEER